MVHSGIDAPESIFVLKPSSFGDIVHTLPAVARLKRAWPGARLAWLVNPEWAPLLAGNPDVDEIVLFPRREFGGLTGWRGFVPWARQHITQRRPHLALDFQGLLRTALVGRLSRPRSLVGLADAREGAALLYHRRVVPPATQPHAIDRYLALADAVIDAPSMPAAERILRFPLPPGDAVDLADETLRPDYILLHPFARGADKSLSTEQVRAFCERLAPRQVVLAGRFNGQLPVLPPGTVNLLNRTTIGQLIWLLRRAAFVISVDSGPMHLAAALGRPLVAMHTWTDPLRVGPYRPDAWVWKNGRLLQTGEFYPGGPSHFHDPDPASAQLNPAQIQLICALATSPSYSCA